MNEDDSGYFSPFLGRSMAAQDAEAREEMERYIRWLSLEVQKVFEKCKGCVYYDNSSNTFTSIGGLSHNQTRVPFRCRIMGVIKGDGECTAFIPREVEDEPGPCVTCRFRVGDVKIMPNGSHYVKCEHGFPTSCFMKERESCRYHEEVKG